MECIIVATRNCNHRPILERQLQGMGIHYTVQFVEDHPELKEKYDIQHSPNLIVDGKVVFRAGGGKSLPSPAEIRDLLQKTSS
jgi:glutaredoxin